MMTRVFSLLLIIAVFSCASTKSEAELAADAKAFNELKSMVNSKDIKFDAKTAFPFQTNNIITVTNALMRNTENGNGRFSLSANEDFIELRKDSSKANLSYFGEMRNVGYSESRDTNIEFDNITENYKVTENDKKKTISISFKVRNETEQFNVKMLLFPNKTANVAIYGANRTTIRYDGIISGISL